MQPNAAIFLTLLLAGCGVDVATTAATGAAVKAQEAKEAQKTLDQARHNLDAAVQAGQQKMEEADKAAGQ